MNTHAPSETSPSIETESVLERRFPRIVQGLITSWHDPDTAAQFLDSILMDERDGRDGFSEDVFEELMFIADLNWKRRHYIEEGVRIIVDSFSFGEP